jgi:hypothetical protein
MKKIKSSLELALEKLQRQGKSEGGEQKDFQFTKYEKAAGALARSFLEGTIEKEQVKQRISRYPQEAHNKAIAAFLKEGAKQVGLGQCEPFLKLCLSLAQEDKELQQVTADLLKICQDYQEKYTLLHNDEGAKIKQKIAEKLAEEGYRGSAIAGYNLEASPAWQQVRENLRKELNQALSKRLQAL